MLRGSFNTFAGSMLTEGKRQKAEAVGQKVQGTRYKGQWMRLIRLLVFFVLFAGILVVQSSGQGTTDTKGRAAIDTGISVEDTALPVIIQPVSASSDSTSKAPPARKEWRMDSSVTPLSPLFRHKVLEHHPYFNFSIAPQLASGPEYRQVKGKEFLFYLIVLLLLIFAVLRRAFPKYFSDLFRLFFRTTLKQRQLQEQLIQETLPSLLLNGFFVVSGGLFLAFLFQHYDLNPAGSFWLLYLYCCGGLAIAYFVKFIGLKMLGWLFHNREAADAYIFVVFIVNKMIGILAIPLLVMLAFSTGSLYSTSLSLSWCMLACLLGYRLILTYGAVRNQVKVNPFHFFLYICAFEIAPLLLVYKALLLYFGITA